MFNNCTLGLEISGFPSLVTIGENITPTCSYDLDLTSIEWLYNGMDISRTTDSQLNLTFSPVNDTVNNRQYTCRIYTAYGVQEENITVRVQGKTNFTYNILKPCAHM